MSLEGRVALVTGAARGIGFAIARACCESAMRVYINDLDPGEAEEAANELRHAGFEAWNAPGDVSSATAVDAIFERIDGAGRPLWLLVNNAGVFHSGPTEDFPESEWDQTFAVDVRSAFLCSRRAIPRMAAGNGGRIIVVSSIAGHIVRSGQIAYCAAKAAAIHFARCLAVEVAPRGITVNCVCPGMTDSEMLRQTAHERGLAVAEYLRMIPAGRLAQPEDHARVITWLARPESDHVTGQVISVDGAQSLYHPLTLQV